MNTFFVGVTTLPVRYSLSAVVITLQSAGLLAAAKDHNVIQIVPISAEKVRCPFLMNSAYWSRRR